VTFVIVLITWVFFRAENLEVAMRYLGAMFGIGGDNPAAAIVTAQVLRPAAIFYFIIAALAAFAAPRTSDILKRLTLTKAIASLLLLVFSLAVMFSQGFNPFLYFQF
jgi:alginate O-acetyltransferase complex protein AlgI